MAYSRRSGVWRCLLLVHLLLVQSQALGIPSHRLLQGNFCAMNCEGRYHTMCPPDPMPPCSAKNFALVDLDLLDLRRNLLQAHNGLRNRIAYRMLVANMVEIEWDMSLEEMSRNYAKACRPFEVDPCANMTKTIRISAFREYYYSDLDPIDFVAQNRFCLKIGHYPPDFIELVISTWYWDKDTISHPIILAHSGWQKMVGHLAGINNFTHIASPYVFRFGCSIARVNEHFCINCMYSPFYVTRSLATTFDQGEPCSMCPFLHAMPHHKYQSLCGRGDRMEDGQRPMATPKIIALWLPAFMVLALQ